MNIIAEVFCFIYIQVMYLTHAFKDKFYVNRFWASCD